MRASEYFAFVTEWNDDRGFGWLDFGGQRLFLHQRDLRPRRKPARGDQIRFVIGQDAQGRRCATRAVNLNVKARRSLGPLLMLPVSLALPTYAFHQSGIDMAWVAGGGLLMSIIAYKAYSADKHRALSRAWRVSEAQLHLIELLGGWTGAWLAQRWLRHKCAKVSYQIIFWCIFVIHQFAAFDSLHAWKHSDQVISTVKAAFGKPEPVNKRPRGRGIQGANLSPLLQVGRGSV